MPVAAAHFLQSKSPSFTEVRVVERRIRNSVFERVLSSRDYEKGHLPDNELQIHTWMDATLGELTQLIKEVNPDARRRGMQFSFSMVTADNSQSRYYLTYIGTTENGQKRSDDHVQLASKRYQIGDYLDVAIMFSPPANARRDRPSEHYSEEGNKRRYGNERSAGGPVRSAPRNDHRDHPY